MYGQPQLGAIDLGRISRIAAAAFGDMPMRGCMGLGYDWNDYLRTGNGPPGGRVTSPNGDVLTFDDTGGPDMLMSHPGAGTDADMEHDPASPFYGWTNREKAAYGAAQGVVVATDQIRAGAVFDPSTQRMTVPQGVINASQAKLVQEAAANPKVAQLLKDTAAGIHQGVNDPATLAATALRVKADADAQKAYNDAMIAWYAAGHTGPYPGTGYNGPASITNKVAAAATTPPTSTPVSIGPRLTLKPFDPGTGSGPYVVPVDFDKPVLMPPADPDPAVQPKSFNWFPVAAAGGALLLAGAMKRRRRRR